MLDQDLIINVVMAIVVYKMSIAVIEYCCIKILAIFLDKKVSGINRKQRVENAIRLANEKLNETKY